MKFEERRAIDPVIASLLLIAIAVAAGVIVYVYVNSLAGGLTGANGGQVTNQIQLESYSFNAISGTGGPSVGTVVDIFVKNVGGSTVSISSIYFDGTALTEWSFASGTSYTQILQVPGSGGSCFAAIPATVTLVGSSSASVSTSGTTTACGTSGATQNCSGVVCIDTGASRAETGLAASPLASQGSTQIVIGLNSPVTSGTSHSLKIVTSTGGQAVFSVTAGRTG